MLTWKKASLIFCILLTLMLVTCFYYDAESLELNDDIRAGLKAHFIKTENGYVHYEYQECNSPGCIVFIHGYSSPMETWDYQFSSLTDSGFTVLRYDLFGRGYSDRPDVNYTPEFYAHQLAQLLQSLKIENPVDLIGLSLGGHIAAQFALENRQKVGKIILVNPQITPLNHTLLELPLIGEFLMTVRVVPGLRHYREQKKYTGFRRALLSTTREFSDIDPISKYADISQHHSVALIWGKRDKNSDLLFGAEIQDALKNISHYVIDDAGHAAHYRRPDLTNRYIFEFLTKQLSH